MALDVCRYTWDMGEVLWVLGGGVGVCGVHFISFCFCKMYVEDVCRLTLDVGMYVYMIFGDVGLHGRG